ncbi:hypothetical protein CCR87_04690 [Rhodobaculum claviforme]|uniref:Exonuclease VII large subunit C-terminal domain-containing protein n=1 Tax=Rhodobaculum claviforme TaxID=1549854 RepID=A0A934TK21_9RHOB|nr:hypothetical protein [Rhodobaculum claviforme]
MRRLAEERRRAGLAAAQMAAAQTARLGRLSDRLAALDRLRQSLGHGATLRRGFALVRADGRVVTAAEAAGAATALELEFHDGRVAVRPGAPRPRPAARPATRPGARGGDGGGDNDGGGDQGQLF